MSIEIDGTEIILKQLSNLVSEDKIEKSLGKACSLVEAEAKKKAPKGRTGELKRSITSEVEGTEGKVFTPLEYAPYIEYGTGLFAEEAGRTDVPWHYKDEQGNWWTTSGQPPQPYLRPALLENRNQIVKIIKEGLSKDD